MKKLVYCISLTLCCITFGTVHAKNVYPKISYFYDGDTVKINDGDAQYKLRISDIDAPERQQKHGLKSRRALMKLCQHADIILDLYDYDRYHRRLGQLTCDNQSVSEYMVSNGHAWLYRRYAQNPQLAQAEKHARQKRIGLWSDKRPIPPWQWRQNHPH
ncbi:MAG: thermonuclease family protein [Methylophilus sp.]|nr:thermonuclease family protein [Methylophilus sp.]